MIQQNSLSIFSLPSRLNWAGALMALAVRDMRLERLLPLCARFRPVGPLETEGCCEEEQEEREAT